MDAKYFDSLDLDTKIKLAISSRDEGVLDVICKSGCDSAIVFAARNKYTSTETLERLSKTTESRSVVDSLLNNPRLLPSARAKLIQRRKAS